ncbi:hypothetical protein I3I95_08500 [bacterium]|nr:hypothetical protein [bacterium]
MRADDQMAAQAVETTAEADGADGTGGERRHAHAEFGLKAAEHIGASLGGDKAERDDEQARAARRMREAARPTDWQTKLAGMSTAQRSDATVECLGRRASFARVLRATMEFCREERESEDVERFVEAQPDFAANRQSARRYLLMLMRTGAVEELGLDADGVAVIVNEQPVAPAPTAAPATAVPTAAADAPADAAADAGRQPAAAPATADALDAAAPADPVAAPADDADPLASVVAWRCRLTEAGEDALARTDPLRRLHDLLDGQPDDRRDVYVDLLAYCEEPRGLGAIADHLAGSPGLETDQWGVMHMEPTAYVGKLDQAGGLAWEDGWVTTEGGRRILDEIA